MSAQDATNEKIDRLQELCDQFPEFKVTQESIVELETKIGDLPEEFDGTKEMYEQTNELEEKKIEEVQELANLTFDEAKMKHTKRIEEQAMKHGMHGRNYASPELSLIGD